MKLVPKRPFTWLLLAVIAYGYVTHYYDDGGKNEAAGQGGTMDVSLVPGDKEPGYLDKPLDTLVKEVSKTDTGKAIVSSIIEQSMKKKYGDKDVSLIAAQNSGKLQVLDTLKGDGDMALCGSTVTVNYESFTEDKLKLDSTIDKKSPVTFRLGGKQVIKGFENGVVGMKKGGKRKLAIPSGLAYGDPEFTSDIAGKNSPVLFDVEVLEVKNGVKINDAMEIENVAEGTGEEALCASDVNLRYKIIEEGKEPAPSVIDFKIGDGVVPVGIERGVLGMQYGSVRRLTLPQEMLAIRGKSIMPADFSLPKEGNLVLEVELLGVK